MTSNGVPGCARDTTGVGYLGVLVVLYLRVLVADLGYLVVQAGVPSCASGGKGLGYLVVLVVVWEWVPGCSPRPRRKHGSGSPPAGAAGSTPAARRT
eukprot:1305137-Rhodomonas_salina.1